MIAAFRATKLDAPLAAPLPTSVHTWAQHYDTTSHWWISVLFAALPLILLLGLMLGLRMKAHRAALIALGTALLIAVVPFHMPAALAGLATGYGILYGLFPIFWIVFPVIFMYELTVRAGRFSLLQECFTGITEDARLQLLLIAFALGAFFEGAAGFGTPVAVCATLLVGLGFRSLEAATLALLANTAPVAFGGLGIPIVALHGVTGLDTLTLARTASFLVAPFCVLIPFWMIAAFAGLGAMLEVWPALLLAGVLFAGVQLAVAIFLGPWLVNIIASLITITALVLLFRVWKPKRILGPQLQNRFQDRMQDRSQDGIQDPMQDRTDSAVALCKPARSAVVRAILPWAILTACVALWGTPAFSRLLNLIGSVSFAIPGLDGVVLRMPPVVPAPHAEPAIFTFNWLSATGSGIFCAAIISAIAMRLKPAEIFAVFRETVWKTRYMAITIAALMGFGFLSRFCGLDGVLGLAFARTGRLYPFFGTLIGWIGTASTGSDTSSNVLFGSLQKLTALQLGIPAVLMAAANSAGGVMGKMIAPQSIVVASTATGVYGDEGGILRRVVLHSLAFVTLMGILVMIVLHTPALLRLMGP